VSVNSTAVDTRARVARRAVAVVLVLAGITACALSLIGERAEALGDFRFLVTMGFLILGPGWAAAGFLRRAPAAHVWLLAAGVGIAVSLLTAQVMVSFGAWRPAAALYVVTLLSVPFLLRHAVVAQ
jgi:hypothetical protein